MKFDLFLSHPETGSICSPRWHLKMILLVCVIFTVFMYSSKAQDKTNIGTSQKIIHVTDFFPDSYVTDGSVMYSQEIQAAIDAAISTGGTLIFPPMVYKVDESGLEVGSNITLSMYGAVFQLGDNCKADGAVFYGENVSDVRFFGGEIIGMNSVWEEGVNIRGIYIKGKSRNILIKDILMHGLSSNGIGVFGTEEEPVREIQVSNVIIKNSSNIYRDYTSDRPGPEPGSKREDQGLIAFYYVEDFIVHGSKFEKSRSDATHFYKSRNGQFMDNKIYQAKMGGYFLEGSENIMASGNIILANGSRGVTIERGSRFCTLSNNVIRNSGREGLWAPNSQQIIVTGNFFEKNGRKTNTEEHLWNANITINDAFDPTNTFTKNYIISNNIIYTTNPQHAAIFIDSDKVEGIDIMNNQFLGDKDHVKIIGDHKDNVNVKGSY